MHLDIGYEIYAIMVISSSDRILIDLHLQGLTSIHADIPAVN